VGGKRDGVHMSHSSLVKRNPRDGAREKGGAAVYRKENRAVRVAIPYKNATATCGAGARGRERKEEDDVNLSL